MLFAQEVFLIQGAIFEVNVQMGAGFLEAVYQECLAMELAARGIPFAADIPLALSYKGRPLRQTYRANFICFDRIIVELKALAALLLEQRAQVLNYLRVTGLKLGLLVNFGCGPKAPASSVSYSDTFVLFMLFVDKILSHGFIAPAASTPWPRSDWLRGCGRSGEAGGPT